MTLSQTDIICVIEATKSFIFLDKFDVKKKKVHSGKAFPFLPALLIFLFIQHIFAINLHCLYYPPANGYYQESLFSFPVVPGPFYLYNSGSFWGPSFQPFYSAPHFTNFFPYPPVFESAPGGMVFPIQPFLRWPYSNQQPFPYLRSGDNFAAFPGSTFYQPQPSEDLIMIYPARYPLSLTNYPYKGIFTLKPETSSPVSSHLKKPEKLSDYPMPANISQAKKAVLRQALDWIFDNPVDLRNNNIVEIGEEILLFYQLYRRAGTQEAEDLCLEYITDQIEEIINLGIFDGPASQPGHGGTAFLFSCSPHCPIEENS